MGRIKNKITRAIGAMKGDATLTSELKAQVGYEICSECGHKTYNNTYEDMEGIIYCDACHTSLTDNTMFIPEEDLGTICKHKVVTDAGALAIASLLAQTDAVTATNFKNHESGTGTTEELSAQTALITPVPARVVGIQLIGTSANIARTVAVITYGAAYDITEHGVFSALAGGTMLDRSKFNAISVTSGTAIQFIYDLTITAGG